MILAKADSTLDVRGQICPYPLIMIKEALKKLTPGQVLEVETDYEPTVSTSIPAFCEKKGYAFEVREVGKKVWKALIQKNN
jgi:tRNA 2-thiouridine synthesizing protein A